MEYGKWRCSVMGRMEDLELRFGEGLKGKSKHGDVVMEELGCIEVVVGSNQGQRNQD